MPRKPSIALNIRLTPEDKLLLNEMLENRNLVLKEFGIEETMASFIRWMIRRTYKETDAGKKRDPKKS